MGGAVEAVVKWYNPIKGFGFVAVDDGQEDAFLHSSLVHKAGIQELKEGTRIRISVAYGAKGRQVDQFYEVLGHDQPNLAGTEDITGSVKWFKDEKGFGFVTDDRGGDIFLHRSVLQSAGMEVIQTGQRVRMKVKSSAKGREACTIDLV